MGWFDDHPILESLGETALNVAGAVPLYGNAVAAVETGYHAVADPTNTPEERAQHAANMESSEVGMIPLLGEAKDAMEAGANAVRTVERIGGASAESTPSPEEILAKKQFPYGVDPYGSSYRSQHEEDTLGPANLPHIPGAI